MRSLTALVFSYFAVFALQYVMAAELTLTAPEAVPAGSNFAVTFAGTHETGDQIGILVPGSGAYTRNGYAYTGQSTKSVELTAPISAGSYDIVYRRRAEIITRTSIQVTDVAVRLSGPASVPAGDAFEVNWSGPAYARDLIRISHADGSPVTDVADIHIANRMGSILTLTAPKIPGDYTVGYVMGDQTLASMSFRVTSTKDNLSAL